MKNDSVVAVFGLKRKKTARCLKKKQTAGGERRRTSCGLRVNLGESRLLTNRHLLEMGIKKTRPAEKKKDFTNRRAYSVSSADSSASSDGLIS